MAPVWTLAQKRITTAPISSFRGPAATPTENNPRWDENRVYATCWRLLTEGKLTGEHIVTPVVAFEDLVTEYPKITSNPEQNIKLGAYFK